MSYSGSVHHLPSDIEEARTCTGATLVDVTVTFGLIDKHEHPADTWAAA